MYTYTHLDPLSQSSDMRATVAIDFGAAVDGFCLDKQRLAVCPYRSLAGDSYISSLTVVHKLSNIVVKVVRLVTCYNKVIRRL